MLRKIILSALLLVCVNFIASASNYRLNEEAIDQLFEQSFDQSGTIASMASAGYQQFNSPNFKSDDGVDKQTIAIIVIAAQYIFTAGILSIIPIHRLILGCDGQGAKVIALYCVTLGGCGFLPLIDGIFLLLDSSKSKYINNPKFLMWTKG